MALIQLNEYMIITYFFERDTKENDFSLHQRIALHHEIADVRYNCCDGLTGARVADRQIFEKLIIVSQAVQVDSAHLSHLMMRPGIAI